MALGALPSAGCVLEPGQEPMLFGVVVIGRSLDPNKVVIDFLNVR